MKSKDLKKLTKFFQKIGVESFRVGGIAVKFKQQQTQPQQLIPLETQSPILSDDELKIADARNLFWSSYNAR